MSGIAKATFSATGTLTGFYGEYPTPPTSFRASPLVESLFQVYDAVVSEKRMAAAAGYFALTAVKTRVRDASWPKESGEARSNRVADAIKMDRAVLHTLHDLATEKGDISTARKVSDKAELDNPRPAHTVAELQWICDAIRLLALRLGEWEANAAGLPLLGMGDLPPYEAAPPAIPGSAHCWSVSCAVDDEVAILGEPVPGVHDERGRRLSQSRRVLLALAPANCSVPSNASRRYPLFLPSSKDLNREFLSELRRVEKKTRLRVRMDGERHDRERLFLTGKAA